MTAGGCTCPRSTVLAPHEPVCPIPLGFPTPAIGTEFMPREDIACTVLAVPVPAVDIFGREMRKVWIRREDTGEEGWYMFGPGAITFDRKPVAT